jgi:hypothetical protein
MSQEIDISNPLSAKCSTCVLCNGLVTIIQASVISGQKRCIPDIRTALKLKTIVVGKEIAGELDGSLSAICEYICEMEASTCSSLDLSHMVAIVVIALKDVALHGAAGERHFNKVSLDGGAFSFDDDVFHSNAANNPLGWQLCGWKREVRMGLRHDKQEKKKGADSGVVIIWAQTNRLFGAFIMQHEASCLNFGFS